MQEVIDFLSLYWREILEVILLIISVVVFIVKKKPVKVIDTVKECITRLLPYCIYEAEKQEDLKGKGEKKKIFALSVLYKLLQEFGYEEVYDQYREYAAEQIEVILSTPQKKEVSIREK